MLNLGAYLSFSAVKIDRSRSDFETMFCSVQPDIPYLKYYLHVQYVTLVSHADRTGDLLAYLIWSVRIFDQSPTC